MSQLLFGLILCFVSFGFYVALNPYEDAGNDALAKACQAQIFFSLLSSVALSYDEETRRDATGLDALLCILFIVPLVMAAVLQSPLPRVVEFILKRNLKRDDIAAGIHAGAAGRRVG